MLLQRLSEFADRLDLPPSGFSYLQVRWLVNLNEEGRCVGVVDLASGSKGRGARGLEVLSPDLRRSGTKTVARLLLDNGEYALGVPRPKTEPGKEALVAERHQAFIEAVRACVDATGDSAVDAVLRFLTSGRPGLDLPPDFDSSLNVTFAVNGDWPINRPAVREYWSKLSVPDEGADSQRMMCIVCGKMKPAVARLPVPIKGIPGGQPMGMPLISANEDAYESFGLKASHIAPICYLCAESTHKAANALIEGQESAPVRIGNLLYVGWTRDPVGFDWSGFMTHPKVDEVEKLLRAPMQGKAMALGLDDTAFYAMALTASGARIVVRDWLDTTLTEVLDNLGRYFTRQRIVAPNGSAGYPLSIYQLAGATVRELDDLPVMVPTLLLNNALRGSPLPKWILFQAVKRNRAEQNVTYARAALIKTFFSGEDTKEADLVALDPDHRSPAYQCGRLLATLEAIQVQAVRPKATLVDRYFGSASGAPASVFGPLLRGAQAHLAKLRKGDRTRGAYVALSERLQEILDHLDALPKVLSLEEQGLFALGFYHQKAADRAAARARSLERQQASGE